MSFLTEIYTSFPWQYFLFLRSQINENCFNWKKSIKHIQPVQGVDSLLKGKIIISLFCLGFFFTVVEYKNKRQSAFLNPQHFAWINIGSLKTLLSLAIAKTPSESNYCTGVSIHFNNKPSLSFLKLFFQIKIKLLHWRSKNLLCEQVFYINTGFFTVKQANASICWQAVCHPQNSINYSHLSKYSQLMGLRVQGQEQPMILLYSTDFTVSIWPARQRLLQTRKCSTYHFSQCRNNFAQSGERLVYICSFLRKQKPGLFSH